MAFNKLYDKIPAWMIGLSLMGVFILFMLSYIEGKPFKIASSEYGFFDKNEQSKINLDEINKILDQIGVSSEVIGNLAKRIDNNKVSLTDIDNKLATIESGISERLEKRGNKFIAKEVNTHLDKLRRSSTEIHKIKEDINKNTLSISNIDDKLDSLSHRLSGKSLVDPIDSLRTELLNEIYKNKALSFQVQGIIQFSNKLYKESLMSFIEAFIFHNYTSSYGNLQRVKKAILEILKEVKPAELKDDPIALHGIDSLLREANSSDIVGIHTDFIRSLERFIHKNNLPIKLRNSSYEKEGINTQVQ